MILLLIVLNSLLIALQVRDFIGLALLENLLLAPCIVCHRTLTQPPAILPRRNRPLTAPVVQTPHCNAEKESCEEAGHQWQTGACSSGVAAVDGPDLKDLKECEARGAVWSAPRCVSGAAGGAGSLVPSISCSHFPAVSAGFIGDNEAVRNLQANTELFFTIAFTVEMSVKILALGFVMHKVRPINPDGLMDYQQHSDPPESFVRVLSTVQARVVHLPPRPFQHGSTLSHPACFVGLVPPPAVEHARLRGCGGECSTKPLPPTSLAPAPRSYEHAYRIGRGVQHFEDTAVHGRR